MENCPERTLSVRAVEHIVLLLSYVSLSPPLGRARWDVNWLNNLLEQSGMDTSVFKAHSTGAASARKANQTVRIDAALKHTGWSKKSTFRKFYDKPFVDINSFQNAVLK